MLIHEKNIFHHAIDNNKIINLIIKAIIKWTLQQYCFYFI